MTWPALSARPSGEKLALDRPENGLCSLVREQEPTPYAGTAEYAAARGFYWDGHLEPLRHEYRKWLRHYAELGLPVRVEKPEDACPSCLTIDTGVCAPSQAPELPSRRCAKGICSCQYRPVMPGR